MTPHHGVRTRNLTKVKNAISVKLTRENPIPHPVSNNKNLTIVIALEISL